MNFANALLSNILLNKKLSLTRVLLCLKEAAIDLAQVSLSLEFKTVAAIICFILLPVNLQCTFNMLVDVIFC